MRILSVLGFLFLAPLAGGLLDGMDRKLSARMQRRVGPPLLQPFYDLKKLFAKQMITVNNVQFLLNLSYLVFIMISGALLFAGTDILMCLFILSTADMFLILSATSDSSPYSNMGASRELVQLMAYEPLTLLVAVGFYLTTGSFQVDSIISRPVSSLLFMPGMLIGFLFSATIKFRKSPFDLSTSHHAHQEMVKGLTTEMSGLNLAIMTIAEYYETILLLSIFALFILNRNPVSIVLAVVFCLAIYFVEILVDNACSRVKWNTMLWGCWLVTLLTAGINLFVLMLIH